MAKSSDPAYSRPQPTIFTTAIEGQGRSAIVRIDAERYPKVEHSNWVEFWVPADGGGAVVRWFIKDKVSDLTMNSERVCFTVPLSRYRSRVSEGSLPPI